MRLAVVNAYAERSVVTLGEPVRVVRVFASREPRPVEVRLEDLTRSPSAAVEVHGPRAHWGYEPSAEPFEPLRVEPGERFAHAVLVELSAPARYTLLVPPQYLTRRNEGLLHRIEVEVLPAADLRSIEEKAERLGVKIAAETSDFPESWSQAHRDLEALGMAAVPLLRRWLLGSESAQLRAVSAKILRRLDAREAADDLIRGLADPHPAVRKMCAKALGGFRVASSLPALLARAGDPDHRVRVAIGEAVSGFDDPRVVPVLRRALRDADEYVRMRAAILLAQQGDATGMSVLISALAKNPAMNATSVVPGLEALAGLSFGKPGNPMIHSSIERIESESRRNEVIAAKWLAWWKEAGKARFAR
jgi:hypothetical protein